MIKRLLFLLALIIGFSMHARATCTTPITAGMNGSQVQTALNSCSAGDTAQFPAGSYAIGTTLVTIPCGVGMSGPTFTWSPTTGLPTAHLNGSASNGGYAGFQTTAGSCGSSVIQYLEWNGQQPSNAGNFLNIRPNTQNLTVQYVWGHGNNSPGPGYNQGPTDIVTISGGGASTPVNNITIRWNYFGNTSFSDCATAMNTGNTNENDNGGGCGGVGINGNLTNVTIQNNIFNFEEQPMKTFDGTCVTCNNLVITQNSFSNYERIAYETQASGTAAPSYNVLQYITYNNWGSRYNNPSQSFLTYAISAANGCANAYLTGSNLCEEHVDYNVYVQAANGANDVGIEMWGMGPNGCTTHCSTATGNWLQGYLYNGITWAWAGNFVFNNNNFNLVNNGTNTNCQSHAGGFWQWDGSDGGSFPIALPSCTGNTFSNAITGTTASVTPTIPATQSFSGTFNVTIGNPFSAQRDQNTTAWCTTNGSTPAPGTGTPYTNGGTITISTTTTVKCIGMWGSPNQPYSYPSGFGYVPSSVVTATYSASGTPTAATPVLTPSSSSFYPTQSVTITDSTTGSTIYYTLDGSTPTTSSNVYSSALTLNATTTVKAIAAASGYLNSAVASGTYTYTTPTLTGATSTNTGGVTSVAVGGTVQQNGQCSYSAGPTYTCNSTDANGSKIITWGSSNSAVFTVSSAGLVTGIATGTANVTCSAQQGSSTPVTCMPYSITVVNSPPTLLGVTIALQNPPGGSTVTIGTPVQACGTMTYTGSITTTQCNNSADAYGTTLSAWNSSSPSNGTISTSGLVTGVANGTTSIKVTATNGSTSFTATPVPITINTAVVGANAGCSGNCLLSGSVVVQ